MNAKNYLTSVDGNAEIQKAKERLFRLAPDFVHAIERDADELAALRAANAELVEALENILIDSVWDGESRDDDEFFVTGKVLSAARAAIAKHKKG